MLLKHPDQSNVGDLIKYVRKIGDKYIRDQKNQRRLSLNGLTQNA